MKNMLLGFVVFFLLVCTAYASPVTHTIEFTGEWGVGSTEIDGVVFDGWAIGFGVAGTGDTPWTSPPTITFTSPVTLLGFDYYSVGDLELYMDGVASDTLLSTLTWSNFTKETFSTMTEATELSFLANNSWDITGLVLDNLTYQTTSTSPTPIPGALVLLSAGMFGMAGLRKRFQK